MGKRKENGDCPPTIFSFKVALRAISLTPPTNPHDNPIPNPHFFTFSSLSGVCLKAMDGWTLVALQYNASHCLVISEIGDRISRVNYYGI